MPERPGSDGVRAGGRAKRVPAARSGLQLAVAVGGILALILVWAGLSYHLRLREAVVREQTHRDVLNLAAAIEKHVERLMIGADQVMRFIAEDLAHDPETFDFQVWAQRATSLDDLAHQLSIYDERGELLGSRTPLAPGMPRFNVRDRAYFQALAARADLGLYVDRTVKGRITGREVFQTARRLSRPDGSFAGVVVVSIDPDYLSRQFQIVDVGRNGSVALFGHDGYVRARFPQVPGMYERNALQIATGRGVFEHLKESPFGTYEAESAFDHATRIFGYRTIGALPLIVTVGKSLDEVMAPFEAERGRAHLAGLAVTALILAVLLILVRELERRRQREQALAVANRALAEKDAASRELIRLHAMAEHVAQVGHWYVRLSDPVHQWSDAMYRIHDVDRGTFVPSAETLVPMIHPDDRAQTEAWWRRVFEEHRDGDDAEHRMRLPSGRTVAVLVRSRIERDAGGAAVAVFGAIMDVTARRQAQAAADRTAALLAKTLDCMDQGLILVDADRTVQVCNRRAAALLELPDAFVAGRPGYRAFRERVRRARRWGDLVADTPVSMSAEDTAGEGRSERRTTAGEVLEIRTIRTADGGMVQTFTDITDRRGVEDRFKLLAENASDLIVLKPAFLGTRSYVAPASRGVVGWEPEELAVLPTDQYVHPDDFERVAAEYASLSSQAPRITSIHRVRHKAGHYIWVETVFQLTNARRPDEAVIVTARDVTARRIAEDALRDSEARHRLLAETTGDIIARLDLASTLRYLSPAVESVLGHAADAMLGRPALDFIHADDRDHVLRQFRALVAAGPGARVKFEYRMRHKAGHFVWLEVNPTVIFDPETGKPREIIDVARDVTPRKAIEAELHAARIVAEQANEAKTDFLASMSHEIRTPLNGIIGYTELMLDDAALSAAQRRQAERIQSAGSALLTVVNDILDFSKIEAGQVDLDPAPFHLAALLDNATSIVRASADLKGLALRLDRDPSAPPRLVGDHNRLRQILLNFLNNALKFTARGEVALSVVRVPAERGTTCRLRFAVSDTGIGIPEGKRHRLFERFSQVDSSVQREFGGTGLGLAISKRLVALMGGTIGVESAEGDGSTFWFEVDLTVAAEAGTPAGSPEARIPLHRARASHILLVEDVEINQEIACAVLEGAGHTVDVAADGLQAITAVQARRYDLVLMDIQMPGMDGMTATRHIRALSSPGGDVPIVAMTANVLPVQVLAFRAAGMNDHIGKPFDRGELHATVERWVGSRTIEA